MIQFKNTYDKLPETFFAKVAPAEVSNPQLLAFNHDLAQKLGLNLGDLKEKQLAHLFSGQNLPPNCNPIALAYAGHQFGSFNPQLGDGRALLLGEVVTPENKKYDLQLKGSGRTPYSRGGDGKSALGPVIREYIVSEAMHALGVPTTRALAAVTTGDKVYREKALPGAIFTRVASSHIRVGTFEYFSNLKDTAQVKILADYTIDRHYPYVTESKNKYLSLLKAVAHNQAKMVAHWMSFGFIHGVMNTDNMSISGETLDYGPCAFMDNFAFARVFSSIDHQGRYSYSNQIPIAKWNLYKLANCLLPLIAIDQDEAIALTEESLETYSSLYEDAWLNQMTKKFGLFKSQPKDLEIIQSWLGYLAEEDLDFTNSFRALSGELEDLIHTPSFTLFYDLWQARLKTQKQSWEDSTTLMNSVNPVFIPRNHQVEAAIQGALQGDLTHFETMNHLFKKPFKEQAEFEDFKRPPKPEERIKATFCGT